MKSAFRWGVLAGALALAGCGTGGGDFAPLAADPGKLIFAETGIYAAEDSNLKVMSFADRHARE